MHLERQEERTGKPSPPKPSAPGNGYRLGGVDHWSQRHSVRPA